MDTRKKEKPKDIEILLAQLSQNFFEAASLESIRKKEIFSVIRKGIQANKEQLQKLIVTEVKLTQKDAAKEVDRAYKTFCIAEKNTDLVLENETTKDGIRIVEKRLARGPLLAITPFSSPLSSPAHKIASGILAGTSVLFKPSSLAKVTGSALFDIIGKATHDRYVFFCESHGKKDLDLIVSDERIGIVSFTGGYETGKEIIQIGGVKKYHMELAGGNSPVFFAPDYTSYSDQLTEKLIDGIVAKNGQRCVSIKHIFISERKRAFITQLQERLLTIRKAVKNDFLEGRERVLGPLITVDYALATEKKVLTILKLAAENVAIIPFERQGDYIFPAMYELKHSQPESIRKILDYEIPGPVCFVHFYKDGPEYAQLLSALKNDYVHSGLQLSIYTNNLSAIKKIAQNLLWGGIIVNDIPTFRNDYMSFGGFGRSGLGKEGFFETINAFTDPQVVVSNLTETLG